MSKETILILDKEFHTQWVMKTLLEGENYIVIPVNTIEKTFQNFREFEVSCFITESRINHFPLIESIRELKRRFPETYIMMLTDAEMGEEEYEEIINAGVDDFFMKPVSSKKILSHIKKGLKQRRISLQRKKMEEEMKRLREKLDQFANVERNQKRAAEYTNV